MQSFDYHSTGSSEYIRRSDPKYSDVEEPGSKVSRYIELKNVID